MMKYEEVLVEKIRRSLEKHLDNPVVEYVDRDFGLLARVISPTFEGMEENRRQTLVWGCILESLSIPDRRDIAFLFTYSPSELKARRQEAEARSTAAH